MKDTIFLQFYDKEINKYNVSFALNNGFSDTWDLCESKGDMFWYNHNINGKNYLNDALYWDNTLPITKGTVYISAVYSFHLYQSCVWAKMYPDINFIVGGPVIFEKCSNDPFNKFLFFKITESLPTNLTLTGLSVEDVLGVPNYSYDWKLILPKEVTEKDTIKFSYTLENQCYWRGCIFCSTTHHNRDHLRSRKHMNLNVEDLKQHHRIMLRLNTGSITPFHIQNFIPQLPTYDHIYYYIFIRIAKRDILCLRDTLKSLDIVPHLKFGIGLEFPSERMWKYINKGFTRDNLSLFSDVCEELGITMSLNFILGWNNLTEEDLVDLEDMLNRIPDSIVESIMLWWLYAFQNTKIYETYDGKNEPDILGPFNFGFTVKVNPYQLQLNKIAGEMIKDRFGNFESFTNFTRGII